MRPNLTFVTEANKAEMKVASDMRDYFAEQERLLAQMTPEERALADANEKPKQELSEEAKAQFEETLAKAKERHARDKAGIDDNEHKGH